MLRSNNLFDIDKSRGSTRIKYGRFNGDAKLELDVDAPSISIDLYVLEDTATKSLATRYYGVIEVDGLNEQFCRDPDYHSVSPRLSVIVHAYRSRVNLIIYKEEEAGAENV